VLKECSGSGLAQVVVECRRRLGVVEFENASLGPW
jgi:hypothetical protein